MESIQRFTGQFIHILFDSYLEISIKRCERARGGGEEEGIELVKIDDFVTIQVQMERFGPVNTNKENLKLYSSKVDIQVSNNLTLSNREVED